MSHACQPRVAFDTAVLLRALVFNDAKSKALRRAWQSGQCQALIARASAQALMKALAFPAFELDESQQHELLADFLPYAEVVDECASSDIEGYCAPLLALTKASAPALSFVVSDCPNMRAELGAYAKPSKQRTFSCCDAGEFLAAL
jgi:hypothetical protein